MNLKLELGEGKYIIINKSTDYGFRSNIYTPVDPSIDSKKTHSKSPNLFFFRLEHIISHLIWEGLDGDDLNQVVESINETRDIICKQLEQLGYF